MIIREWRGRTSRARSSDYPEHFRNEVVPGLRRIQGFLGALLSRRESDDRVEFVVLTRWTSMEAIHAFAGPAPENAVVEPAAIAALTDYDATVRHYDVLEDIFTG